MPCFFGWLLATAAAVTAVFLAGTQNNSACSRQSSASKPVEVQTDWSVFTAVLRNVQTFTSFIDLDNDKLISEFEYDSFFSSLESQCGVDGVFMNYCFEEPQFAELDTNQDGYLSFDEWQNVSLRTTEEDLSSSTKETRTSTSISAITLLRDFVGVSVYNNTDLTWDHLAGSAEVKQKLIGAVVIPLKFPHLIEEIASRTGMGIESDRQPRAVLLEGPRGTGKALTARILASECGVPLVVIDLFTAMQWADNDEKLTDFLEACKYLGSAIIFIDDIIPLPERNEYVEIQRFQTSVLQRVRRLQDIGGKIVMIGATNRKDYLDQDLLSPFHLTLSFSLPDRETRRQIFSAYAKHLTAKNQQQNQQNHQQHSTSSPIMGSQSGGDDGSWDVLKSPWDVLAAQTDGLSCRDLREVCAEAERASAVRAVTTRSTRSFTASCSGSRSRSGSGSEAGVGGCGTDTKIDSETLPTLSDYHTAIKNKQQSSK